MPDLHLRTTYEPPAHGSGIQDVWSQWDASLPDAETLETLDDLQLSEACTLCSDAHNAW